MPSIPQNCTHSIGVEAVKEVPKALNILLDTMSQSEILVEGLYGDLSPIMFDYDAPLVHNGPGEEALCTPLAVTISSIEYRLRLLNTKIRLLRDRCQL